MSSGEVHIWWIDVLRVKTHEAQKLLQAISRDERDKASLLLFERDRLSHGLAHGFIRFVLSSYTGVSPASWKFEKTAHGKPIIPHGPDRSDLDFSISHSDRFVGCAVSKGRTCGFDIESSRRWETRSPKTTGCLTEVESAVLNRAPASSKWSLLNQLWCAKESYLKAKGVGFLRDPASIPLHFDVDQGLFLSNVRVQDDLGWSFVVAPLGSGYHMAAATSDLGTEAARFRVMSHEIDELIGALS